MAIPITCPGCKAAFEVPENLAGKTIRCTSCKTQLTVSEPTAAAPAADSKKPFGWAGKSSAANPAAKPLSLDDDKPAPAKTRPAAANGKPAVKTDVTVDEEDEKTSPAKKPAKAAAAKPAAKKHDDDDDDDFEPAKKKRKNASGGSGGMIALIGGGLLALAAIAGLSIWLLTGDDKKTDTADSGAGAPPPPGDRGGMPGRGMPGRGGPGGEMPGGEIPGGEIPGGGSPVGAGGWQTFTTGGFSAEFPGTPTQDNGSFLGGGAGGVPPESNLKTYVLKNGTDSGYFVVSMDLPAQAANLDPKALLDQFAQGAEKGMGGFGGGRSQVGIGAKLDITQDGFQGKELQMVDKRAGGKGGGVMRVVLARTKLYMYGSASDNYTAMRADTDRFIKSVKISAGDGGIAIGGPNDPTRPGGGGYGQPRPRPGDGGGAGGYTPPGGGGSGGYTQPRPRPGGGGGAGGYTPPGGGAGGYTPPGGGIVPPGGTGGVTPPDGGGGAVVPPPPGGVEPPGDGNPQVPPPGGGGQPGVGLPDGGGQPGGGIGQPGGGIGPRPGGGLGQPGGGIGQPGGGIGFPGGSTGDTGKLAARVNEHFVGVFDGSKKEFFAISGRLDKGRAAGELRRYSYPSFKLEGTVRIPSVATRAVIDPKTQLLYVTTVGTTLPAMLQPERFDRPAVAGGIAIYDLGQLRSGKVEEQSDFKSVGTINLGTGRVVRDLVLSEDGKTLYALTGATKGKATVSAIDTTERKVTKTKDLPNAAWEMNLRPSDGKLLVSYMPGQGGGAGIGVVDPVAMTISATIPLAKGFAYNMAVAKDGRAVISVPSGTANSPLSLELVDGDNPPAPAIKAQLTGQSNNGYVAITPDGKHLLASTHHPEKRGGAGAAPTMDGGFDVYETSDSSMGEKKVSAMKRATDRSGELAVGGTFVVSPDSEYVVFSTGAVLKMDDLGTTGNAGGGVIGGGGIGEPGGNPFPPPGGGIVPPGGGIAPPGGVAPPGGIGIPGGNPGIPGQPGGGRPGRPGGVPAMPPGGIPIGPATPGQPGGNPMQPPGGVAPPGGVPLQPPGGLPIGPAVPGQPGGGNPVSPPGGVPLQPPGGVAPPGGGAAPPPGLPGGTTPPGRPGGRPAPGGAGGNPGNSTAPGIG